MAPQVGWVSSGQARPDGPFPKRLGVELSGRDSPQAAQRLMSPMGTNLQATSTGIDNDKSFINEQVIKVRPTFQHKQSTRLGDHHVNHPTLQLLTVTPRINPYQMRTAAAPHPHLRTAVASHPPSPCWSQTQPPVGPVAGSVHPSRPGAPNIRPRAPPATAPGVFHITRKGQLHIEALLLSYALYLPTVRYLDATRVGGGPSRGCSYPLKKTLVDLYTVMQL
ncbi:hypothetical protein Tco_1417964 [Tanacetum coccineum]